MPCNTCKWKGRTDVCSPHKSMQAMMEDLCPNQWGGESTPFFQRHPTIEIRFLDKAVNRANDIAIRGLKRDRIRIRIQEQCLQTILENDL